MCYCVSAVCSFCCRGLSWQEVEQKVWSLKTISFIILAHSLFKCHYCILAILRIISQNFLCVINYWMWWLVGSFRTKSWISSLCCCWRLLRFFMFVSILYNWGQPLGDKSRRRAAQEGVDYKLYLLIETKHEIKWRLLN